MILDVHAHLMSEGFSRNHRFNLWNLILFRKLGLASPEEYLAKLQDDLAGSPVRQVVLSAIENSPFAAGNAQVLELCRKKTIFLYGANLNPCSPTLEADMEEAVRNHVVLVKLLPSFQGINPADDRCLPFWEMLRDRHLPVLVHTGPEHTFNGENRLNNPELLERAADMGITLICAHCGCQMMLHERNYFRQWAKLAYRHPNVFGDVSGFSGCLRHHWLKRILQDDLLQSRILFGTDYPSFPYVLKHNHPNIFLGWLDFFRAAGCPDSFFHKAAEILQLA